MITNVRKIFNLIIIKRYFNKKIIYLDNISTQISYVMQGEVPNQTCFPDQ